MTRILFACCILLGVIPAGATTRHVNADGSGIYPTIQAAVDACAVSDTILCSPGVYRGSGNVDLHFNGTDLVLLSSAGPEVTIIDCEEVWSITGIHLTGGETRNAVVDGFTIRRCYNYVGGGIEIAMSSATLRNLIIEDCAAGATGGSGGGIVAIDTSLLLEDSLIRDCFADEGGGGGIRLSGDGSPELRRVVFEGNYTFGFGGGLMAYTTTAPVLEDLVFRENSGHWGGGLGIYCGDSLQISGLVFERNFAVQGAGLYGTAHPLQISFCAFIENNALWNERRGGGASVSGNVEIANSTFVFNRAAGGGSGIEIRNPVSGLLNGLVVVDGVGAGIIWDGQGEQPWIECIDAYGNTGGNYGENLGDQTGINGNISMLPLFCGSQGGNDPFSMELHSNSPCLPENNECGLLMGAYGEGCAFVAAKGSWEIDSTRLLQNRPNPFNPKTEINFVLADRTEVSLRIYDAAGRRIVSLLDGEILPAGHHRVAWDGNNAEGQAQASGAYFYQLDAANFSETKKMILMK